MCVETFGDPTMPAILLIHGACASMLWWEEALCRRIASGGRYVIRFDNRDTGRSVFYPAGQPGYSMSDLARDAVGILDALNVERAHVVGQSMAGGIALILGVDHPERVWTLTFVGTTTGDDSLPGMSAEFLSHASRTPDAADGASVVEFIVGLTRAYSGGSRYFDERRMRKLAAQDVARTLSMASALVNHFDMRVDGPQRGGFGDVAARCLVVHGEQDPVFPLPHAHALMAALPDARLLVLEGAGHEIPEPLWPMFASALLRHTAAEDE